MLIADWINKRKETIDTVDRITYKQAFCVGLFQCLALYSDFPAQAQRLPEVSLSA